MGLKGHLIKYLMHIYEFSHFGFRVKKTSEIESQFVHNSLSLTTQEWTTIRLRCWGMLAGKLYLD